MKEIVLAGGCFWGIQAYMSRIDGVISTCVGYANGNTEKPTYEDVCMGNTGYAEACHIKYDENVIGLEELLYKFWKIIDPTSLNRQGPDLGSQYRTGIFYMDKDDLKVINRTLKEKQKEYEKPIVTEILPLSNFFEAEEYHQDYLEKNPNGYCHIDLNA